MLPLCSFSPPSAITSWHWSDNQRAGCPSDRRISGSTVNTSILDICWLSPDQLIKIFRSHCLVHRSVFFGCLKVSLSVLECSRGLFKSVTTLLIFQLLCRPADNGCLHQSFADHGCLHQSFATLLVLCCMIHPPAWPSHDFCNGYAISGPSFVCNTIIIIISSSLSSSSQT